MKQQELNEHSKMDKPLWLWLFYRDVCRSANPFLTTVLVIGHILVPLILFSANRDGLVSDSIAQFIILFLLSHFAFMVGVGFFYREILPVQQDDKQGKRGYAIASLSMLVAMVLSSYGFYQCVVV